MSKKKQIAIVELESHNEVLRAYLLVLLELDYTIFCMTTVFNYKQLGDLQERDTIQFILKESKETYEHYFLEHERKLAECEVAIVTTLPLRDVFFSSYQFPCKSIFVVHKYHTYFTPTKHIKLESIKDVGRFIKGKIARYTLTYQKAISNFSGIVMPSKMSYEYAKKEDMHGENKLLGSLDFAVNEYVSKPQSHDLLQVIIPGTIGLKSRDYTPVIKALRGLQDRLDSNVQVHLLGRPQGSYGTDIINKCKALENKYLTFCFYNDFIHQDKFDQIMHSADFLILPIAEYMKFDIYKEKNGFSCVSGNINDMVKYGLPSILPSYYPLDKRLEKTVERYKDGDELQQILGKWIKHKKYNMIKVDALDVFNFYSPSVMSRKFGRVLEQLV